MYDSNAAVPRVSISSGGWYILGLFSRLKSCDPARDQHINGVHVTLAHVQIRLGLEGTGGFTQVNQRAHIVP